MQSFLEALDRGAEVAQFDVNFGFLNVNFRDRLVIEKHFVELHKCRVKVFTFKGFFSPSQFLQNLVFLNLIEVEFGLSNRTWISNGRKA